MGVLPRESSRESGAGFRVEAPQLQPSPALRPGEGARICNGLKIVRWRVVGSSGRGRSGRTPMVRLALRAVLALVLVLGVAPGSARAQAPGDPPGRVGRLSYVTG